MTLLKLLVLACMASAVQDSTQLHRTFKDGEKLTYSMHMTELLESAEADVESTWTETAKNVSTNGDADLETAFTAYKITAGGMEVPAPAPAPRTVHVDKHGIEPLSEIEAITSVSRLAPDLFAAYLYDLPFKQGATTAITYTDSSVSTSKVSGTAKLDAIDKGIATVEAQLKFESASFDSPLLVEIKAFVDVATGQLDHLEGKLTHIPTKLAGRYSVQAAQFLVKRG